MITTRNRILNTLALSLLTLLAAGAAHADRWYEDCLRYKSQKKADGSRLYTDDALCRMGCGSVLPQSPQNRQACSAAAGASRQSGGSSPSGGGFPPMGDYSTNSSGGSSPSQSGGSTGLPPMGDYFTSPPAAQGASGGAPVRNAPQPPPAAPSAPPAASAAHDVSGEFSPVAGPADEKEESLLKKYLWNNSFDAASDANKKAARSCGHDRLCESSSQTAAKISKEQSVMADVSRVSDAVGMAAVGGTAANEMRKKSDQKKSLESVAKMHQVAGAANLAAGATDLGLAGYAWLSQKKRLETEVAEINKKLGGLSVAANAKFRDDPQREQKIAAYKKQLEERKLTIEKELGNALQKTKDASLQHAKWGAGKLAAGAASAKLAKDAAKQSKELQSLSSSTQTQNYSGVLYGVGMPPAYENNNPQVQLVGGASTNTLGSSPAGGTGTPSGGASLPSSAFKNSNLLTERKAAGITDAKTGSASTGSGRSPASVNGSASGEGSSASTTDSASSSWGSGGGSPYRGAGDGGTNPFGDIMQTILGGQQDAASEGRFPAASGDAVVGGAMMVEEGVVSGDSPKTLFDLVKTKHIQMVNQGRLSAGGAQ